MTPITDKVATLWPEMTMLIGATVCLFVGLAKTPSVRRATPWIAGATLVLAAVAVSFSATPTNGIGLGAMAVYVKLAVVAVGLVLLLVAAGVPDTLSQIRDAEATDAGRSFEPGNTFRGEFFAFFLLSLTGVMLTAGADDLAWLFLALELTSLPTYVMVATSRDRLGAQESGVKYFFLGALGAAIFLYGFALIYTATGFTSFAVYDEAGRVVGGIRHAVVEHARATGGGVQPLMLVGAMLAVVGICFKIAAVPMHFYAADVYEGAATPVTAFLAFVPKAAGFVALILIVGLVGWDYGPNAASLPEPLAILLWVIAAMTMTIGNVLGLLQSSVKRVLAYSSIAHSGYMLVGVLAGPGVARAAGVEVGGGSALSNGIAAVLFYLVAYGFGTIASFAVLGCIRSGQPDADPDDGAHTFDDLHGLAKRSPVLAAAMLVSVLSLVGLPPLVGFLGKLYLLGPLMEVGGVFAVSLVVIVVLNSAISAGYYLRIAAACFFGEPGEGVSLPDLPLRRTGAVAAAAFALLLGLPLWVGDRLVDTARFAATPAPHQSLIAPPAVAEAPANAEPAHDEGPLAAAAAHD